MITERQIKAAAMALAGNVSEAQWDANPDEHWRLDDARLALEAAARARGDRERKLVEALRRIAEPWRGGSHYLVGDDRNTARAALAEYQKGGDAIEPNASTAVDTAPAEKCEPGGGEHPRELVGIVGDEIVIRVPVSAIPIAAGLAWERRSTRDLRVTCLPAFAQEIIQQLKSEKENGDTLVTDMLDAACIRAVEYGAEGVEIEERT